MCVCVLFIEYFICILRLLYLYFEGVQLVNFCDYIAYEEQSGDKMPTVYINRQQSQQVQVRCVLRTRIETLFYDLCVFVVTDFTRVVDDVPQHCQ